MARGIAQLYLALTQILPLPVVIGIAAVAVVLGLPMWVESIRGRQINGLVRRMVRAEPAERQQLAQQALVLAGTRPRRLLLVAEASVKYDQRRLREAAVDALARHGGDPRDVPAARRRPQAVPQGAGPGGRRDPHRAAAGAGARRRRRRALRGRAPRLPRRRPPRRAGGPVQRASGAR
ncbi:MAG: hypothetical protein R3F59_17290 [Myxococcota bacterium]